MAGKLLTKRIRVILYFVGMSMAVGCMGPRNFRLACLPRGKPRCCHLSALARVPRQPCWF